MFIGGRWKFFLAEFDYIATHLIYLYFVKSLEELLKNIRWNFSIEFDWYIAIHLIHVYFIVKLLIVKSD